MTDRVDALTALHTALIDSRNGYETALEHADGKGLGPLFQDMITLRNTHASEIASALAAQGHAPDSDGSFMSAVHWAVINVRALVTGLDESILPGLIDGEKRIVSYYDDAVAASAGWGPVLSILEKQRSAVLAKIAAMEQRAGKAAA